MRRILALPLPPAPRRRAQSRFYSGKKVPAFPDTVSSLPQPLFREFKHETVLRDFGIRHMPEFDVHCVGTGKGNSKIENGPANTGRGEQRIRFRPVPQAGREGRQPVLLALQHLVCSRYDVRGGEGEHGEGNGPDPALYTGKRQAAFGLRPPDPENQWDRREKAPFQLQVANALWADKNDFEPDPKFLRTTRTDYHAAFELVDFLKNSEGSRHRINGWVEEQTKKKIVDLIPSGGITEETRLLIVNAIYFKGDWSLPFPKSATKPDDFTMSGESAFKVPMMNRSYFASYFGDVFGDFRLAQLSYKGDEVSMIVVLPVAIDGLAKVEQNLSAKALEQVLARAKPAPLQVSLPKFKLSEQFNVSSELNSLGMRDAFDKKVSDFTGMEIQKAGRKQSLHISDVVHKAIVDVAEESTEAAAATALIIPAPLSIDAPPPPPIVPFLADHPFPDFCASQPDRHHSLYLHFPK